MTAEELSAWNVGMNLDHLMTLDPRGYGVCRILYEGARKYAGEPVTMHSARAMCELLKPGDVVYILTGFILRPHKHPETDGIVGAILLARALVKAFDAKPILICPEENLPAIRNCTSLIGLHFYEDPEEVKEFPYAFGAVPFTKKKEEAKAQARALYEKLPPKVVFSTEAPGANEKGEYHNAVGVNMTELEAKMDVVFEMAEKKRIPTFAVGDLGNEIGMGTLASHIKRYIPYTEAGGCKCGCGAGILAATKADYVITGTTSDWGVYGLIGAIAYLKRDIAVLHDRETEERVLRECARSGMVDMTGSLLPGIDGFDVSMNCMIVELMRETTAYALSYENETWFEVTLNKGFFQNNEEDKYQKKAV